MQYPEYVDGLQKQIQSRPYLGVYKVKEDNWNDQARIRVSAFKLEPVEFDKESHIVANEIRKILGEV